MASFSEQLSAARKAAGMTQEELSAAVHVARNTISNWEHGRTQPDLDTMRLLGQVLHVDFLNGDAAVPVPEAEKKEALTNESAVNGESTPAHFPQKKKIIVFCAAALIVIAAAIILLVSYNAKMSKSAEVTLTALHDPAPMIADPAFEPDGLGWEFAFVITNGSEVPFKPQKGTMLYYKDDSVTSNMDLDYAFLRGCMYGDTITNADPAPVYINWGASYPLFTSVELQLQGTDDHGHEIKLKATVQLSQEKPQE